jgi:hypothetical protein
MSDFPTHIIRDLRHKAIGASEKAILFSLADRMQSPTDWVWPALETIAADAGLSEVQCRRILKWMRSVGIIVERNGEHKGKDRQIDFGRLTSFPVDAGGPTRVSPGEGRLSPRTLSPGDPALSRDVHGERGGVSPGEPSAITVNPKGPMKDQMKVPEKDTADVPSRALVSFERPLALPFGSTITATNAKPRVTNRAGPKRKFTDEQIAARDAVYKFWKKTYFDEFKVEPIVGNAEVGQMVNLLKKLNWDADAACVLIANAFTYAFFRERIKTIGHILGNASAFQFPASAQAESRKPTARMSTMQSEPDLWADHEEQLATEHG